MPPVQGYTPIDVPAWSGLCTLLDATNLPIFMSPDCRNVEYLPKLVRTRPGTVSYFSTLTGLPSVNYLKTYITQLLANRLLVLDSLGNLYKEDPQGTLVSIGTIEQPGAYCNSVSLFSNEYMAFGDQQFGTACPRQYNDTSIYRVSRCGPGSSPAVGDYNQAYTIVSITESDGGGLTITGLVNSGDGTGTCAVNTSLPSTIHGTLVAPGQKFEITSNTAGWNGTYTITAVIYQSPTLSEFQFSGVSPALPTSTNGTALFGIFEVTIASTLPIGFLGSTALITGSSVAAYNTTSDVLQTESSGGSSFAWLYNGTIFAAGSASGGTITTAGNISAGLHQCSVSFITASGYITVPAPPSSWTATGGKQVTVTNIPTGPADVVGRLLMFTPIVSTVQTGALGTFFSILSTMQILDNTTTSVILDFTDTALLQGESEDYLFELDELPEAAGVTEYNSRLFWWGVRNALPNFLNLSFDGGYQTASGTTVPLGWTLDGTSGAGGSVNTSLGVFYDSWQIKGDGSTATRGMITQPCYQDAYSARIFENYTAYSVRLRAEKDLGMTAAANIVVDVYVPSTATVLGTFTVSASSISNVNFNEFSGALIDATHAIPTDAVIRLYANGTPTNLLNFYIDNLEFFPTNSPYLTTDIWGSGVELPQNYRGLDGLISVAPENGQPVTSVFRIRNYLYPVKTSSLYVTSDDGDEPGTWTVNEVSPKVGTPAPRGVGLGDEWAVIAGQTGLYYFDGASITDEDKLSTEIQPTWNRINWQYGQFVDVKVDTTRKRVYVAVPLDSSTIPNVMLVLDYVEGFGNPLDGNGVGRKWTIWDIPCNSMNFALRDDGTQPLFIGNNVANGKIYELSSSAKNDDGVAINSYQQTAFFQANTRLNFGYLLANIVGSGTCNLTLRAGSQSYLHALRGWTLSSIGRYNQERQIQMDSSRMAIVFGTNATTDWFSLQGTSIFVQPSTWSPYRGTNNPNS